MMRFARAFASSLFVAALTSVVVAQSDWPQFRGKNGDGVAVPQALAHVWGEAGPKELWRHKFGSGFSTVASVGDRLYTMGATEENEEAVCLDAGTGEALWRVPLGIRFLDKFGDGPRATPTVDGDMVFVVSSTMHLAALSTADGKVRWQKELLAEFGIKQPRYGYAASVLVTGDRAVLYIGAGKGKAVAAFERDTGEVLWTALDGRPCKTTPLLVEIAGVPQLIFNRPTELTSLSLDGELLWAHKAAPDVIAMAQFIPPDLVLTSSAHMGLGAVVLRVSKKAEGFAVETAWINRRFRNHFNNAVLVKGHLYGFDNSTLRCLNAKTGATVWSKRGFGKGSLVACNDSLYVLSDQGMLVYVAADPLAYRELGRVKAMKGRCWTSPSLGSGRLFVRNLEEIVAYDVGAVASGPSPVAAPEIASVKPVTQTSDLQLAAVLKRYTEARGGLAQWRAAKTLEMKGVFTAFSESGPFKLRRRRDRLYRFDYTMSGKPDARGRDGEDLWWRYHRFRIEEPSRVELKGYHWQMKRESMFEPALLAAEEKNIKLVLLGAGKVNGKPTVDLELTFPGGEVETWRLDPETFLEVAVDSTIVDMNQSRESMTKRVFYSDFRKVGGLVLPFRLALEFGSRLETIVVEKVKVNPELAPAVFDMGNK